MRSKLMKDFNGLSFFTTNIKPRDQLAPVDANRIERLVRSAFICHLNEAAEEDDLASAKKVNFA